MKIHLYNLPSVDQYVNQLIASYIGIQSEFSQGDILLVDKINKLQQKSRYMIKTIDEFMNKNSLDPRVKYLFSSRNKLSKFLFKINENKLIKNVNEIRENQSVYNTSSNKKYLNSISAQKYQSNLSNNQGVISQKLNESRQSDLEPNSSFINHSHGKSNNHQFSDVKSYQIQQQSPQAYKKTPRNNLDKIGHNHTPSTKMKPYQQFEKQKGQQSFYQKRQKSRTPKKTSRKVQSFIPKSINLPSARQRQNNEKSSITNIQKPHTARVNQKTKKGATNNFQPQKKTYYKKPGTSTITPRKEMNPNNVIEKTPPKVTSANRTNNSHDISNSQIDMNDRQNTPNTKYVQKLQTGRSQTSPNKQQSSAMKSLANLIFTIKMTKQEYNEFKKIKQLHEGKNGLMQHNSQTNGKYIQ